MGVFWIHLLKGIDGCEKNGVSLRGFSVLREIGRCCSYIFPPPAVNLCPRIKVGKMGELGFILTHL